MLFGATGYTGRLTARALVEGGARPVLAGRGRERLDALAAELGGLEVALADAASPESVRGLVAGGDVLVTTVGPMARFGLAALEAALDRGAHYVDSSGESSWVRFVFEHMAAAAKRAGTAVLPALAYDSVPGNLAAALALEEAGDRADRVRVGYFVTGAGRGLRAGLRQMSGGSRATFARMALEPAFAYRGGRLVTERGSARVGRFRVAGEIRRGVSFGTTEALSLPRLYPSVRDVETYFGWFDRASHLLRVGAMPLSALARVRPIRLGLHAVAARAGSSGDAPADERSGSLFVAEALAGDALLARVVMEGINGYAFSGRMIAWAASRLAAGSVTVTGVHGPVEAFGLGPLMEGVAEAGIERTA